MTEKGCDNCYYSYFDERAYPCSLCIRGIERTDQWQPSKKTKADRKTEPITHDDYIETENDHLEARCLNCHNAKACKENNWQGCRFEPIEGEPQTDGYMTAEQTEDYRKMLDKAEHKVYGNIEDEPQTDLLVTEYPQDGEVNLIGRDKTEAVVMAYDVYKELTEPQTEREETISCQKCKWWFTDSLKHGGYCQSFLYNQECRYEPQERSK